MEAFFFNTFLRQKNNRLQKYRFPFLIVCMAIGAFSRKWIGGWKALLIMMAYVLLCLIFYKAAFVQSVFFSVLNYGMLIGIEYLSISAMDWACFLYSLVGRKPGGGVFVDPAVKDIMDRGASGGTKAQAAAGGRLSADQ